MFFFPVFVQLSSVLSSSCFLLIRTLLTFEYLIASSPLHHHYQHNKIPHPTLLPTSHPPPSSLLLGNDPLILPLLHRLHLSSQKLHFFHRQRSKIWLVLMFMVSPDLNCGLRVLDNPPFLIVERGVVSPGYDDHEDDQDDRDPAGAFAAGHYDANWDVMWCGGVGGR